MSTSLFFFNDTATTEIYTLSLHDALPISQGRGRGRRSARGTGESYSKGSVSRARELIGGERIAAPFGVCAFNVGRVHGLRSEEHTSELQSRQYLVCRLLLEKKTKTTNKS